MTDMAPAEPLRQQYFDRSADEIRGCMSEQLGDLVVGEQDVAMGIDDDYGVWERIENTPDERGREHCRESPIPGIGEDCTAA
jgi:hypothetical protein